jgi:hypothetical protein
VSWLHCPSLEALLLIITSSSLVQAKQVLFSLSLTISILQRFPGKDRSFEAQLLLVQMENNLTDCRLHRQSVNASFLTVEIFTFLQAGTGIAEMIAMEITKHVCAPNHVPKSFFFEVINL